MFFKKKDHRHFQGKGEKLLASQNHAEARIAFQEALELLPADQQGTDASRHLQELIAITGNQLAIRNIEEAEAAMRGGASSKAREYLSLALTLAEDVSVREKTEKLLDALQSNQSVHAPKQEHHSCGGCSSPSPATPLKQGASGDFLSSEERFELLIQPLPANLPNRYAGLGEKFAFAYLSAADGNYEQSLKVFLELLAEQENDIILYEAAVQQHQLGLLEDCEENLLRAYRLNPANPLCCIGLVQLYCDTGRASAALELLQCMIEMNVEPEHAVLSMGDIYRDSDHPDKAIDCYSRVLTGASARAAAERIIPLLEMSGRTDEAKILFKRFLKGCC